MSKQQGQAQLGILILIIIGLIFLATTGNLADIFKRNTEKTSSSKSSQSIFQQRTEISSNQEAQEPEPDVPDNTPPKCSNPEPKGSLDAQTRKIVMSLKTDEKAICRYSDVEGVAYDYMQDKFQPFASTSHSVLITTLSEGGEYTYYIRCIDEQGNKNTDDFEISFKVKEEEDITPPIRTNAYPTGDVFLASTTQVTIGISTDEPASCRYNTEQGKAYGSGRGLAHYDESKRYHIARITGLSPGNSYQYFVRCKDLKGNVNDGDVMIYFTVAQQ